MSRRGCITDGYRMKMPATAKVRCLGPGKEHSFRSTDPIRHRICDACTAKIKAMSPRAGDAPVRFPD